MQNAAQQLHNEPSIELLLPPGILTIGQHPDNDNVLSDPLVSQYHARIVTYFHQSYVLDLSSETGTWLNGERIIKHSLKEGDIVHLGNHQFIIKMLSLN